MTNMTDIAVYGKTLKIFFSKKHGIETVVYKSILDSYTRAFSISRCICVAAYLFHIYLSWVDLSSASIYSLIQPMLLYFKVLHKC